MKSILFSDKTTLRRRQLNIQSFKTRLFIDFNNTVIDHRNHSIMRIVVSFVVRIRHRIADECRVLITDEQGGKKN